MTDYAAFLLKIWREPNHPEARIVIKNIDTGESAVLNSVETLLKYLATSSPQQNEDCDEHSTKANSAA